MKSNFFNERRFSSAMFFCRIMSCLAFVYFFLAVFFQLRAFTENLNALSGKWPFNVHASFAFCLLGSFASLGLLMGYRTRLSAGLLLILTAGGFFVFEGNSFDKTYIAFMLFALAAAAPVISMGPGAISLDYKRAVEKERIFLSR